MSVSATPGMASTRPYMMCLSTSYLKPFLLIGTGLTLHLFQVITEMFLLNETSPGHPIKNGSPRPCLSFTVLSLILLFAFAKVLLTSDMPTYLSLPAMTSVLYGPCSVSAFLNDGAQVSQVVPGTSKRAVDKYLLKD